MEATVRSLRTARTQYASTVLSGKPGDPRGGPRRPAVAEATRKPTFLAGRRPEESVRPEAHSVVDDPMRHSCASLLIQQGVPVKTVSSLLGRRSVELTLDRASRPLSRTLAIEEFAHRAAQ